MKFKKGEQQHQRKLNNQTQSAIQYSTSQDDKLISNLKTPNNKVATPTANRQFYTKFVKRFTKQLRFSDSTYKLNLQNGNSNEVKRQLSIHIRYLQFKTWAILCVIS